MKCFFEIVLSFIIDYSKSKEMNVVGVFSLQENNFGCISMEMEVEYA